MAESSKRGRVMSRSKKLGHCICDPRKPCPCDLFLEKNVCTCAGERLEEETSSERPAALTKLVKNAGCASKIPPADLARILARLPAIKDPRLLVGHGTADDAGVFQVSPELSLVQTVDVFAPSVDDPYQFGQVAVCNSLSDVYAMGGTPVCALSIISYPIHTLNHEWMYRMLKGGMDKLAEADVVLAGGHSINGEEILFGFAVTGTISPDAIVTNAGARPGDALILTKPIGTGVISFAAQMGRAPEASVRAIGESMATLNRAASEVMCRMPAHACTDVTGFGLLGHLYQVVRESGVTAEVWWDAAPTFPGARECVEQGILSGAAERNREFAGNVVEIGGGVPEHGVEILYDAQTSGGLLIAVAGESARETLKALHEAGCAEAAIVGRIVENSAGRIRITGKADERNPVKGGRKMEEPQAKQPDAPAGHAECCAPGSSPAAPGDAQAAFSEFMSKAFAPGALDIVQKELMTIALSVAVQCEPCLKIHLDKARGMGISAEEMEEAAWMGVAFGGCKAMMFWKEKSQFSSSGADECCAS